MRGVAVEVGKGPGMPGIVFRPEEYWKGQQQSSVWMWENAGEDLREFINDRYPKKGIREKRLLWKSYALKEAEKRILELENRGETPEPPLGGEPPRKLKH